MLAAANARCRRARSVPTSVPTSSVSVHAPHTDAAAAAAASGGSRKAALHGSSSQLAAPPAAQGKDKAAKDADCAAKFGAGATCGAHDKCESGGIVRACVVT